jgi:hypothetical protein
MTIFVPPDVGSSKFRGAPVVITRFGATRDCGHVVGTPELVENAKSGLACAGR